RRSAPWVAAAGPAPPRRAAASGPCGRGGWPPGAGLGRRRARARRLPRRLALLRRLALVPGRPRRASVLARPALVPDQAHSLVARPADGSRRTTSAVDGRSS